MRLANCIEQWRGLRKPDFEKRIEISSDLVMRKYDLAKTKRFILGLNKTVNSFARIIRDAVQTIINKETLAVKRAAKKYFGERGVSGFDTWMNTFYSVHKDYIYSKLMPIYRSYQEIIVERAGSIIGSEIGAGDLEQFFQSTMKNYVHNHVHSSRGQLNQIMKEVPLEDMESFINTRMDEWYETRATKIARDESTRLANATSRETWIKGGVTKIRWLTQGKTNCPFCDSLEGRIVGIEKPFLDVGDVMYVSDTGWLDIYNPNLPENPNEPYGGKYKEKESPSVIPEGTKVSSLKIYGTKYHPPIHMG